MQSVDVGESKVIYSLSGILASVIIFEEETKCSEQASVVFLPPSEIRVQLEHFQRSHNCAQSCYSAGSCGARVTTDKEQSNLR